MPKRSRIEDDQASPFLRSIKVVVEQLVKQAQSENREMSAIDAGCGNGRNSEFIKSLGGQVLSLDKDSEYGEKYDLSEGKLPEKQADLVLLQFVLMFLPLTARYSLVKEAFDKIWAGGVVVVELFAAKTGFMTKDEIKDFMRWMEKEASDKGIKVLAREDIKMAFIKNPIAKGGRNEKSVQGAGRQG